MKEGISSHHVIHKLLRRRLMTWGKTVQGKIRVGIKTSDHWSWQRNRIVLSLSSLQWLSQNIILDSWSGRISRRNKRSKDSKPQEDKRHRWSKTTGQWLWQLKKRKDTKSILCRHHFFKRFQDKNSQNRNRTCITNTVAVRHVYCWLYLKYNWWHQFFGLKTGTPR